MVKLANVDSCDVTYHIFRSHMTHTCFDYCPSSTIVAIYTTVVAILHENLSNCYGYSLYNFFSEVALLHRILVVCECR